MCRFCFFFLRRRRPPRSTLFPSPALFRSARVVPLLLLLLLARCVPLLLLLLVARCVPLLLLLLVARCVRPRRIAKVPKRDKFVFDVLDRKSTRLNSSYTSTPYAAFCLKKKNSLHIPIASPPYPPFPPRSLFFFFPPPTPLPSLSPPPLLIHPLLASPSHLLSLLLLL